MENAMAGTWDFIVTAYSTVYRYYPFALEKDAAINDSLTFIMKDFRAWL
jgi:hypothetical protein